VSDLLPSLSDVAVSVIRPIRLPDSRRAYAVTHSVRPNSAYGYLTRTAATGLALSVVLALALLPVAIALAG
jgi:hypothetical protein